MHFVTTFYQFFSIPQPDALKAQLETQAQELGIQGLIILGPEGLNSTVSSTDLLSLQTFKAFVQSLTPTAFQFKDSESEVRPFRRFVVKVREEIVTLGTPELRPDMEINHHLNPAEWDAMMKEQDAVLIDTRNWYEYQIGTFKGALNPNTEKFTEFPKFMESQNISKDKKIMIFCTGGIRCEKGILELQRQGYKNVFQLHGGILRYLAEKPREQFEGECFVFDHRVAVDQDLKPSEKYKLCPHCGQPALQPITCQRCDHETLICEPCEIKMGHVCSKNCAHHWSMRPGIKGPRQQPTWV